MPRKAEARKALGKGGRAVAAPDDGRPPQTFVLENSAVEVENGAYHRVRLNLFDPRLIEQYTQQAAACNPPTTPCPYIWLHEQSVGFGISYDCQDRAWYVGIPCSKAADYHIRYTLNGSHPGKPPYVMVSWMCAFLLRTSTATCAVGVQ